MQRDKMSDALTEGETTGGMGVESTFFDGKVPRLPQFSRASTRTENKTSTRANQRPAPQKR